jgi:hypothetical protein
MPIVRNASVAAVLLLSLTAGTTTVAAADQSSVAPTLNAQTPSAPTGAIAQNPADDATELQSHPRCEMNCRRAFLRCVNRVRGECNGDIQCLRERGSGCMDHYRACRQDNCGSSADDIPLPRLPF